MGSFSGEIGRHLLRVTAPARRRVRQSLQPATDAAAPLAPPKPVAVKAKLSRPPEAPRFNLTRPEPSGPVVTRPEAAGAVVLKEPAGPVVKRKEPAAPVLERPGPSGPGLRRRQASGTRFLLRESTPELQPLPEPLPPLPLTHRIDPAAELAAMPEAPSWSPVRVALPLFAAVWICFAFLAVRGTTLSVDAIAGLGHVLASGAAVLAVVMITLSVVHNQVSGLRPQEEVVLVVAGGLSQGILAMAIGSGHDDMWRIGGHVFQLIGLAVPLAWVGGQFQQGVRRRRVEQHASLVASWIERARIQAHQTVESVHRHDVRSLLFVIDGAAQTLADETITADQRESFGEMLTDTVERLRDAVDARAEVIHPFAVNDVVRAVVHAERKEGRPVVATLPPALRAEGRSDDVAAALRTVLTVTDRKAGAGAQLRADLADGVVVVHVEPVGAEPLPLSRGNWEEIWAEAFKAPQNSDEETIDLYVAARLLAEQGADLWSTAGRDRFAVRMPSVTDTGS